MAADPDKSLGRSPMSEPTSGPAAGGADRDGAGRIRRLTQAALNADLTIERVEGVLGEIIATVNWLLTPVAVARTQLGRVADLPGAGAVNGALGVLTGRGRPSP